jgi:hypothetical protein
VAAIVDGVHRVAARDERLGELLVPAAVLPDPVHDQDDRLRLARLPHVVVDRHALGVDEGVIGAGGGDLGHGDIFAPVQH